MLDGLVEDIPDAARKLMERFWPGPLTLLLKRTSAVPDASDSGKAAGGRAHAGTPGRAGVDPARGGSGGCTEREPVWTCEPDDG
ncbi:MAG: Sua5/YciO/YrdC/YwlC family protein [Terracidiphilus sp.]